MIVRGKVKNQAALFSVGRQQVLICDLNISLADYVYLSSYNLKLLSAPHVQWGERVLFFNACNSSRNELNEILFCETEYFRAILRFCFRCEHFSPSTILRDRERICEGNNINVNECWRSFKTGYNSHFNWK